MLVKTDANNGPGIVMELQWPKSWFFFIAVRLKWGDSDLGLNPFMKNQSPDVSCPKCRVKPEKSQLWYCVCGHSWNTFDTGGSCPNCQKAWHKTQCPSCDAWSHHIDWYPRISRQLRSELSNLFRIKRKKILLKVLRERANIPLKERKKIKGGYFLFKIPPLKN